jgi:hypothetical protein
MEQEDLIVLRDNITEIENLIDTSTGFGVAINADTGDVALCRGGDYYKIKDVIKHDETDTSEMTKSIERILLLAEEIKGDMAQYIHHYGKLPPELRTQ